MNTQTIPRGRASDRLETLMVAARHRTTAIVVEPAAKLRMGCLPLWPADGSDLSSRATALPPRQVMAVVWGGGAYRLAVLDCDTWSLVEGGRPVQVDPVDLTQAITRNDHGPRAVLEAIALIVRFELGAVIHYAKGDNVERRQIERAKVWPKPGTLVAVDKAKDSVRSFKLAKIVGVELTPGQAVPLWSYVAYQPPE